MGKVLIAAAVVVTAAAVVGGARVWASQDVETPAYQVEAAQGAFEVRQYPAMVAAQVDRQGDRGAAVRAAFSPLAGYIFAKDRPGEKIAMTAPVTQEPDDNGWTVSFIMPEGRTLADLPTPAGDVTLVDIPPRRMAAMSFSGRWTDARFQQHSDQLLAWVTAQGLTTIGDVEFAYYNDPFTPAFMRRNEVMVEIASRQ
ncbi:MAG: heme-binding protein [Pseudomonadota bacterium]